VLAVTEEEFKEAWTSRFSIPALMVKQWLRLLGIAFSLELKTELHI
jgi:hypothetical protein